MWELQCERARLEREKTFITYIHSERVLFIGTPRLDVRLDRVRGSEYIDDDVVYCSLLKNKKKVRPLLAKTRCGLYQPKSMAFVICQLRAERPNILSYS